MGVLPLFQAACSPIWRLATNLWSLFTYCAVPGPDDFDFTRSGSATHPFIQYFSPTHCLSISSIPPCEVKTMCCLSGHQRSSGTNQSETRWCPSAPPASWGIVQPTGSRAASSEWRYWGQPCSWGQIEPPLASACGAESDCSRKKHRLVTLF